MDEETRKKLEEWNRTVGTNPIGVNSDLKNKSDNKNQEDNPLKALEKDLSAEIPPELEKDVPKAEEKATPPIPVAPTGTSTLQEKADALLTKTEPDNAPPSPPDPSQPIPKPPQEPVPGVGSAVEKIDNNTPLKTANEATLQEIADQSLASSKKATPEGLPKKEVGSGETLARIRTYETDAAEAVKRGRTSLSSMVLAEQKSRALKRSEEEPERDEEKSDSSSRAFVYGLISMALIMGGAGLVYGWYRFAYLPERDTVQIEAVQAIITANRAEEVPFVFENRTQLVEFLEAVKESPRIGVGEVYAAMFVRETIVNERPAKEPVFARSFLETLAVNAPLSLYRSLEGEFIYGVHRVGQAELSNEPFMILRTNFFQNAFISMINWESLVLRDLDFMRAQIEVPEPPAPVIEPNDEDPLEVATTTDEDTTTPDSPPEPEEAFTFEPDPRFRDEVIRNRDARVARDSAGNVVFMYSFIDENTLVITNNIQTFEEVLRRATLPRFQ